MTFAFPFAEEGSASTPMSSDPPSRVARQVHELNEAMVRLFFPPEGMDRADLVGLAADVHAASLRLWLAAMAAPAHLMVGAAPGLDPVEAPPPMPRERPSTTLAAARKASAAPAYPLPVVAAPSRAPDNDFGSLRAGKPAPVKASPVKTPTEPPAALVDGIDSAGDFPDDAVAMVEPAFRPKPDGAFDNLMAIKGIGPKLNQLLHDLGIWHYRQIAAWTPGEIAWINAKLDFPGRVQRERWVAQARELAARAA